MVWQSVTTTTTTTTPTTNNNNNNNNNNHMISECSKLAHKEFKTTHDWVGKVIYLELCKKLKFDYSIKWCIHKPEPVQEIEMHKALRDSKIQTADLIPARNPT